MILWFWFCDICQPKHFVPPEILFWCWDAENLVRGDSNLKTHQSLSIPEASRQSTVRTMKALYIPQSFCFFPDFFDIARTSGNHCSHCIFRRCLSLEVSWMNKNIKMLIFDISTAVTAVCRLQRSCIRLWLDQGRSLTEELHLKHTQNIKQIPPYIILWLWELGITTTTRLLPPLIHQLQRISFNDQILKIYFFYLKRVFFVIQEYQQKFVSL